ncbi:MAG: hypothetical protein JW884_13655, partial [Deltaproteobacteria bacterium]|nr:hypothetical protein [Deltaproteobacteria bacterium]
NGEEHLRTPVSYLLKLALADAVSSCTCPAIVRETAEMAMNHYTNDNTSPEITSFTPVRLDPAKGLGRNIVGETLIRYILSQFLILYANNVFQLRVLDQEIRLYSAPHPPVRQKELNDIIPDSFYREIFMNPCLSGWDQGEKKYEYMKLCHSVLSRSQLNTLVKLKEAGIISSNLVVIPNVSNICLANNSTHVSLGSRKLSSLLSDKHEAFGAAEEKRLGDLAIKIVEHFLPLFVGTYSAAPYRFDFCDFHPEKALGFLPHELDYTHLRMIWRRWQKKANIKVFGRPVTPFGPLWFDRIFSFIFRLKGDYIPDFRLLDYFAAIMSTEECPALDGVLGNCERLKRDLAEMGVYDVNLAPYFLYRLREFKKMGFSGFEGRFHSLFPSFLTDMAPAVGLQNLTTVLAYKYIFSGAVQNGDIPDTPVVESERRQIFFGSAIGIPTFFIKSDTTNTFMMRILSRTARIRSSRRYAAYLRVYNREYRLALIKTLREDGADLIEMLGMGETLDDLELRIKNPELSAANRLTHGILRKTETQSPMDLSGSEFNKASESYYREELRIKHFEEAYDELLRTLSDIRKKTNGLIGAAIYEISQGKALEDLLITLRQETLQGTVSPDVLRRLIYLNLLAVRHLCERERTQNGS